MKTSVSGGGAAGPASQRRTGWQWWLAIVGTSVGVACLVLGLALGLGLKHQPSAPGEATQQLGQPRVALESTCPANSMQGYELTTFILGDWGFNGRRQRLVSSLMGTLGQCYKPSFVISTGDNFYGSGLKGPNDPYFKSTFTDVYTAQSLQVPWYAVLGNHDYGDTLDAGKLAGCSAPTLNACPADCCYSPVWETMMNKKDSRWNAQQGVWKRSFLNGKVDIFFIDTSPMTGTYWNAIWAKNPGGITSRSSFKDKITLINLLRSSTAQWKLVVGHHPVRSFGEHCAGNPDCPAMQFLKPWLKQFKVAAYFAGHDHDLQHIKAQGTGPNVDPTHYVVSGAGGSTREGEFAGKSPLILRDARFLSDVPGFVAAGIKGNVLTLHFWNTNNPNAPAYTVDIPKP